MQKYKNFFYSKKAKGPELIINYNKSKENKKINFFKNIEKFSSVKNYDKKKSKDYDFFTHYGSLFWEGYFISENVVFYRRIKRPLIDRLKEIFYSSLKIVKTKIRIKQHKKRQKIKRNQVLLWINLNNSNWITVSRTSKKKNIIYIILIQWMSLLKQTIKMLIHLKQ